MSGLAPQRVAAVVVAAGRGERLGMPRKALLPLAGHPMLAWSLASLERADTIGAVVVVAGTHIADDVARLVQDGGFAKVIAIVPGGERRQDSVAAGLAALPAEMTVVAIHDAARPLAGPDLFDRCVQEAAERGAAIAAAPVADTLKRVAGGVISETVDRTALWAAQTPQAFQIDLLRQAMATCGDRQVTDDALLCEIVGVPVSIVPSSAANLKVTHDEDIAIAEALLRVGGETLTPNPSPIAPGEGTATGLTGVREPLVAQRSTLTPLPPSPCAQGEGSPGGSAAASSSPSPVAMGEGGRGVRAEVGDPKASISQTFVSASSPVRTGIGYDVHRFAPDRRLVLGGVEIAYEQGLLGHSDADVLLHAIADAVLGAAALGDIGQHFPPSDERFRDADSQDLLRESVCLARVAGWQPAQVDATLLAEAPRIGPHVPRMRECIAACLGVAMDAVSVKATTNEGLGAIGRREGIAALATATLVPVPSVEGR